MNKKGFTLIELISTFALASVIIVLLMNVVILIKDVYNQNNVKTELMIEQSNLSKIMNEEFNKEVIDYEWCNDSTFCYNFTFNDGSSAKLQIDNNLSKITFNNYVYKTDKGVDIVDPKVMREYVDINDDTNTDNFIRIKIPIVSKLYPNKDFGVDIVFEGNESKNNNSGGTDPEEPESESSICTLASTSSLIEGQIGAKYNCKVNDETTYTFFIISHNDDGTSNLIMDQNLYYNEETQSSGVSSKDNPGYVTWWNENSLGSNQYGPVVAMTYLHNATKDWSNIPNIVINYEDENTTTKKEDGASYGGIFTTGNTTIIKYRNDLYDTATFVDLKARFVTLSEVKSAGCTKSYNTCPSWMTNNLGYIKNEEGTTNLYFIEGYWSLSSSSNASSQAYYVNNDGNYDSHSVCTYDTNRVGIRPVITVDLNPGE